MSMSVMLTAKGDLLTPMEMDMVGFSTVMGGSGRGSAMSKKEGPFCVSF